VIERKFIRLCLREQLHCKFPLRVLTRLDGFEHIAAMEVLIGTSDLHGFVPYRGLQAKLWTPVKFDEG
jgi:hypothetical protein